MHPAANPSLLSARIRFEGSSFSICRDDVKRDMTMAQLREQVRPHAPAELQEGYVIIAFDSGQPVTDTYVESCQRSGKKHDCEFLFRRSTWQEVNVVREAMLAQEEVEKALRKRDATYNAVLEMTEKYKKAKV
jgi:hypothetical protein